MILQEIQKLKDTKIKTSTQIELLEIKLCGKIFNLVKSTFFEQISPLIYFVVMNLNDIIKDIECLSTESRY